MVKIRKIRNVNRRNGRSTNRRSESTNRSSYYIAAVIILTLLFIGVNFGSFTAPVEVANAYTGRSDPTVSIVFPVDGLNNYGAYHHDYPATDIFGAKQTPLVAVVSGTLDNVGYGGGKSGYRLWIRGDDGNKYFYCHLNNDPDPNADHTGATNPVYAYAVNPATGKLFKTGDRVAAGQRIGYLGDSGNAEPGSAHLHFEIWLNSQTRISPYNSLKNATPPQAPAFQDPIRNQVFVVTLYRRVLNRAPSSDELAHYVSDLNNNVRSRGEVVTSIVDSRERHIRFVERQYDELLDRVGYDYDLTQAEVKNAAAAMDSGLTEAQLMKEFCSSSEFSAKNPSDVDFIVGLYTHLLKRLPERDPAPNNPPGKDEVADWLANHWTRQQYASAFVDSHERHARFVEEQYRVLLRRAGYGQDLTQAEVDGWAYQMDSGLTESELIKSFCKSQEFWDRTADSSIRKLYRDLLRRDASEQEVLSRRAGLNGEKTTIAQIVDELIGSTERHARFTQQQYDDLLERARLGKETSSDEILFQAAAMDNGLTEAQLIKNVSSSEEFFNNRLRSNDKFVRDLYALLFNRIPNAGDEETISTWVIHLNNGLDRSYVANSLVDSHERRRAFAAQQYSDLLGRSGGESEVDGWAAAMDSGLSEAELMRNFCQSLEYWLKV